MKQLTTSQQLRWAVYNCPTLIPSIVNNRHLNKSLSTHILHDMLPRRTSIEIECFGKLHESLMNAGELTNIKTAQCENTNSLIKAWKYQSIIEKYSLLDFAIDDHGIFDIDYNEHKISIRNYTQLVGLYNILKDMSKYCTLNTSSGCHIHLNIGKTMLLPGFTGAKLRDWFTYRCKDGSIESIFSPAPANSTSSCCFTNDKTGWLNINTNYQSLEFRCGSMTFDYSTIVKWFIGVNRLLNQFEHSLRITSVQPTQESPSVAVMRARLDQRRRDRGLPTIRGRIQLSI